MLWVYTSAVATACRVGLITDATSGTSALFAKFPAAAYPCSVTFAASTLVTYTSTAVVVNAGAATITAAPMPTSIPFVPVFAINYWVHSLTLTNVPDVVAVHYLGVNTAAYSTNNIFVGADVGAITGANCALRLSITPAGLMYVGSAHGDLQTVSATPFTCTYSLPTGTLAVTTASGTVMVTSAPAALTFAPGSMVATLINAAGASTATLTFRKVGSAVDAQIIYLSMDYSLAEYYTPLVLLILKGTPTGCRIWLTLGFDQSTIVATSPDTTTCSATLTPTTYVAIVTSYDVPAAGAYIEILQATAPVTITLN